MAILLHTKTMQVTVEDPRDYGAGPDMIVDTNIALTETVIINPAINGELLSPETVYPDHKWDGAKIVELTQREKDDRDMPITKTDKYRELAEWKAAKVAAGFDTGKGYRLSLTEESRKNFTQFMMLRQLTDTLPTDTVTIGDMDEKFRSMRWGECRPILRDYGLFLEQLWATGQAKKNEIRDESDIKRARSITMPS
jgi:hypothetical protein